MLAALDSAWLECTFLFGELALDFACVPEYLLGLGMSPSGM